MEYTYLLILGLAMRLALPRDVCTRLEQTWGTRLSLFAITMRKTLLAQPAGYSEEEEEDMRDVRSRAK